MKDGSYPGFVRSTAFYVVVLRIFIDGDENRVAETLFTTAARLPAMAIAARRQ